MDAIIAARRDMVLDEIRRGPRLMGILNVTPDSFSDGGRFDTADAALAEAKRHIEGGAIIVDIGAESTRPGFTPVPPDVEIARLQHTLAALVDGLVVPISVDTTKAAIARTALAAGAAIVNDQWGLQGDPAMAEVVADGEAAAILMHNRSGKDTAVDIVDDLRRFFDRSLAIAAAAGIPPSRLILDPGIGFGKTKAQNVRALGAGVAALRAAYDLPVMVGASRKSLFAALIGAQEVGARLYGTIGAHVTAYAHGAALFRVHDCAPHRDALTVMQAICEASGAGMVDLAQPHA